MRWQGLPVARPHSSLQLLETKFLLQSAMRTLDATAFEQASAIRPYVADIRDSASAVSGIATEELDDWVSWALAQAERLGLAVGDRFLVSMQDV